MCRSESAPASPVSLVAEVEGAGSCVGIALVLTDPVGTSGGRAMSRISGAAGLLSTAGGVDVPGRSDSATAIAPKTNVPTMAALLLPFPVLTGNSDVEGIDDADGCGVRVSGGAEICCGIVASRDVADTAFGPKDVPHCSQNFASGGFPAPHDGHVALKASPPISCVVSTCMDYRANVLPLLTFSPRYRVWMDVNRLNDKLLHSYADR